MSSPPDWNADVYHQISQPQFLWGLEVLAQLQLKGDETVIDAGCGTGRLTAQLAERLPRGRVIALDASDAMLEKAKAELKPFGDRISFQRADLADLKLDGVADIVFSTATFHWVLDHRALFAGLFRALKPGGRLHAQCGGLGNLAEHLKLAMGILKLENVAYPTFFADAAGSIARLKEAGFDDAQAWLRPAPTSFPDAAGFRTFITHVTLRTVVGTLGDQADAFLDAVVSASAPRYTLDYVRLELRGVRR